jgi:hypothetical protein
MEITARNQLTLFGLNADRTLWKGAVVNSDALERLDFPRTSFIPTTERDYDYPTNSSPPWADIVQGVTHDANNWYLVSQYGIRKLPVEHDIDDHDDSHYVKAPIPNELYQGAKGWDHLGSPDYAAGKVYVPLEHSTHGDLPYVVVYGEDLHTIAYAQLPYPNPTREAPWVAINPIDGLLYTSDWNIVGNGTGAPVNPIRKYRIVWTSPTTVRFDLVGYQILVDESGQPLSMFKIGGGAFSRKGHLYLSTDLGRYESCPAGAPAVDCRGGVWAFDENGKRRSTTYVDYDRSARQELEGLTLWDLDDGRAPNMFGELHLMMGKADTFWYKTVFFKHYELADKSDKGKI